MSNNGKLVAILSYILIGIIWYFADEKLKKDKFVKLHVKQSLLLLIVSIILPIIAIFPILGWIIAILGDIALLIAWIYGLITAINGSTNKIPFVGNYAEKIFKF